MTSAEEENQEDVMESDLLSERKAIHKIEDEATESAESKVEAIYFFLKEDAPLNKEYVGKLRQFAISKYGLVRDDLRKKIWPKLLSLEEKECQEMPDEASLKNHSEYHQVELDVNRSLKRFPPYLEFDKRIAKQSELTKLILRVLTKHTELRYYQGYHDVAITFLLVVGENEAFRIMERLSLKHLRPFMDSTMEKTSKLLDYLYPLLRYEDRELYDRMMEADVGTMFCLPWFITWYSHTLTNHETVLRCFDFFLASNRLLPLYLAACIVLHRKEDVMRAPSDMATIHQLLSKMPEDLPFEDLFEKAKIMHAAFPPHVVEQQAVDWRAECDAKLEAEIQERQRRAQEAIPRSTIITRVNLWVQRHRWNIIRVSFGVFVFLCTALYSNLYEERRTLR